jgi:hypothetical protein
MGQSTGWLRRMNSRTALRVRLMRSLAVWTSMPSITCAWQAGTGFGDLFESTRHMRQFAAMERPG